MTGRKQGEPLQAGRSTGRGGTDDLSRWHREDHWHGRVGIPVDEQDLDGRRVAAQVHLVFLLATLILKISMERHTVTTTV